MTQPDHPSPTGAAALTSPAGLPHYLHPLGHEVYAVDTGFEREKFDAAYLVVRQGRAAFIDTGHNAAVPRLLGALGALGLTPGAVDWVIPTHVHLDHAGGAGLLMSHLPVARALIHPRGARHLIDPRALMAGAIGVYGQAVVHATYGELVPIPAERVVESQVIDRPEGMTVMLGDRPLLVIDSPGHARHHQAVWDAASRGWFSGDTFGISYREFDGPRGVDDCYIMPSSTPVQFEPDAMRRSIQRMLSFDPLCLYPTHFSRLTQPQCLAEQLYPQIDAFEQGALAWRAAQPHAHTVDEATRDAAMLAIVQQALLDGVARAGSPVGREDTLALLEIDIRLNAQGLGIWLSKQA
jgi:glyoxylase-like metal-dependent hydrolase (beta-lactamase superfamily II)